MLLKTWLAAIPLLICSAWIYAETTAKSGIAWEVHGNWYLNHEQHPLHKGDDVPPGALLTADTTANGSILVLLPDGQRLFYDCHDAHTCSQGFRIPALMAEPDKDALELFDTIRRVMKQVTSTASLPKAPVVSTTTIVETVVPIQSDGSIALKRPFAALPPGHYRLTLQGESEAEPSEHSLSWSGPHDEGHLALEGPGTYRLRLFGSLGGERLRVFILAVPSESFSSTQKDFEETNKDLQEWNEIFPGWPIHEWLQLYLRSLSGTQPEKD